MSAARACSVCVCAGTQFDFDFVYPNTTTPQPGFDSPYFLTFFDADGEKIDDGSGTNKAFLEMHAVVGATEVLTYNTSDVVTGVMSPSDALYAVVNRTAQVATTFDVNPLDTAIPAAWLPGVVSFKIGLQGSESKAPSQLKVVVGGRLASANVKDGGFCFAPVFADLGLGCPSQPPSPLLPSPPAPPSPPETPPPTHPPSAPPPAAPPLAPEPAVPRPASPPTGHHHAQASPAAA